jgi:hypothetical protein
MPAVWKLVDVGIGCATGSTSVTAANVGLDQTGANVLAQAAWNAEGQCFSECRGSGLRLPQGIQLKSAQGKSGERRPRIVCKIGQDAIERNYRIGRMAREPRHVRQGEQIIDPKAL